MTIQTFPNTLAGEAAAAAVPGPKSVWYDLPRGIVVSTGADYQPPPPKTSISIQEFRDRLTQAETDAILAASRTDVNIDRAIWLLSTQEDGLLHFDDQRVSSTLAYLVGKGLLAPERPAQLLA